MATITKVSEKSFHTIFYHVTYYIFSYDIRRRIQAIPFNLYLCNRYSTSSYSSETTTYFVEPLLYVHHGFTGDNPSSRRCWSVCLYATRWRTDRYQVSENLFTLHLLLFTIHRPTFSSYSVQTNQTAFSAGGAEIKGFGEKKNNRE